MDSKDTRLRPPPGERFAGTQHVFDLKEMARALRAEEHAAWNGHRQMTIFRRGGVTQVLFTFEPDGELADHVADGVVTIHVLEGTLLVEAEGQLHELKGGHVLVLDANVCHSVRARDAAAMLLTVYLEDKR